MKTVRTLLAALLIAALSIPAVPQRAEARFICTAPDMVTYMHICLGINPVPILDAPTLAQETKNLAENIAKTAALTKKLALEAAKLTEMVNLLKVLGNPLDAIGALTGLGQLRGILNVVGEINQLANFFKGLMSGKIPGLPIIEKQLRALVPQGMSGINHSSIASAQSGADSFFSFGGAGNAQVMSERRAFLRSEATDAQAASVIAKHHLSGNAEILDKLQEALKNSKNMREDWQANTKARLVLYEAMHTRLTLLNRLTSLKATTTLTGAGDDANRSAPR